MISFLLDIYSEEELLDYMKVVFFGGGRGGTSIVFSVVLYQFTFPPTIYEGSLSSTSLPA